MWCAGPIPAHHENELQKVPTIGTGERAPTDRDQPMRGRASRNCFTKTTAAHTAAIPNGTPLPTLWSGPRSTPAALPAGRPAGPGQSGPTQPPPHRVDHGRHEPLERLLRHPEHEFAVRGSKPEDG